VRRSWLLGLLLAASCGDSTTGPPPPPGTPQGEVPPRYGRLTGRVRVLSDDIAPISGSIRGFEKYCGSGPLDLGLYRVDPATKGLAGAYVEADGKSEEFGTGSVPVLDQKGCLFAPVLLIVSPGPVVFKNSDGMAHNITIQGKRNPVVSDGFPGGNSISKAFPFEERLVVRCSIHPWMQAGLVVTRGSAHAVTDAAGRFTIDRVEAGHRKIKVWHLLRDEVTVEVDIPPDGAADIEIEWKPRPNFRDAFGR